MSGVRHAWSHPTSSGSRQEFSIILKPDLLAVRILSELLYLAQCLLRGEVVLEEGHEKPERILNGLKSAVSFLAGVCAIADIVCVTHPQIDRFVSPPSDSPGSDIGHCRAWDDLDGVKAATIRARLSLPLLQVPKKVVAKRENVTGHLCQRRELRVRAQQCSHAVPSVSEQAPFALHPALLGQWRRQQGGEVLMVIAGPHEGDSIPVHYSTARAFGGTA